MQRALTDITVPIGALFALFAHVELHARVYNLVTNCRATRDDYDLPFRRTEAVGRIEALNNKPASVKVPLKSYDIRMHNAFLRRAVWRQTFRCKITQKCY